MWLRGYSRSLKLVPFKSLGDVSYSPSIVTIAVSVAVCEIFSVKEWCEQYLVSFARYSDLLVENRAIFISHLYLAPPQGVTPSEFREDV